MQEILPILILLAVIGVVLWRLPKIDLGHSDAFRTRRFLNWFPLGLTYAFLYMGRYNLTVSQKVFVEMPGPSGDPIMGNADFGAIFGIGTAVYGASFLINGPLTDKHGGKVAILVGAGGAAVANLLMGLCTWQVVAGGALAPTIVEFFLPIYSVLYGLNMYFQSFGAVAIVKVNAPWFHVRERGVFGAIFGILISLGIYFAFDVGFKITEHFDLQWVFLVPAILLTVFWFIDFAWVETSPATAGHDDFDTQDASSGDEGPQLPPGQVFRMMMRNPIIMTIAFIEFCSGFLRQAIMQWYRSFAKQTDVALGETASFVYDNWGLLLCCAGILGGTVAGVISDRVFGSRRGPVAGLLYGVMLAGSIVLIFTYTTPIVGWLVVVMSMAVIGVHGMLSGTASMDFGGRKNVGIAVGIIDGFVYAGTAFMSFTYAIILPEAEVVDGEVVGPAADPANWLGWPIAMVPMSLIGLFLATRIWNARPQPKRAAASEDPDESAERREAAE